MVLSLYSAVAMHFISSSLCRILPSGGTDALPCGAHVRRRMGDNVQGGEHSQQECCDGFDSRVLHGGVAQLVRACDS